MNFVCERDASEEKDGDSGFRGFSLQTPLVHVQKKPGVQCREFGRQTRLRWAQCCGNRNKSTSPRCSLSWSFIPQNISNVPPSQTVVTAVICNFAIAMADIADEKEDRGGRLALFGKGEGPDGQNDDLDQRSKEARKEVCLDFNT